MRVTILVLTMLFAAFFKLHAADANVRLYFASGQKADVQLSQVHIYSLNNANTDFILRLDIADSQIPLKPNEVVDPMTLQIDGHHYFSSGWGSSRGSGQSKDFNVHGQGEAEAIARCFSVDCDLRSPPGYKLYTQFIPLKSVFSTNEAVIVKLQLRNMDNRTVLFQRGGQQRGYRDNQYGFRAQFSQGKIWREAVPDIGNPLNFGGLFTLVSLDPGKDFEDQIDLKKWFGFDKAGTYTIHGFYQLDFYRPSLSGESMIPWNEIWSDYASADFTVVVK